jgi:hypothetical protein
MQGTLSHARADKQAELWLNGARWAVWGFGWNACTGKQWKTSSPKDSPCGKWLILENSSVTPLERLSCSPRLPYKSKKNAHLTNQKPAWLRGIACH